MRRRPVPTEDIPNDEFLFGVPPNAEFGRAETVRDKKYFFRRQGGHFLVTWEGTDGLFTAYVQRKKSFLDGKYSWRTGFLYRGEDSIYAYDHFRVGSYISSQLGLNLDSLIVEYRKKIKKQRK